MTIAEIKKYPIKPFDIDDEKMIKLFSFFLHSAPTIESNGAAKLLPERLAINWKNYIETFDDEYHRFVSSTDYFQSTREKCGLLETNIIKRRFKGFVCVKKESQEKHWECVLRHIRNSIAHDNVFLLNAGNRKYVLFEDYNKVQKQTALFLMSQTDLTFLKREIMK